MIIISSDQNTHKLLQFVASDMQINDGHLGFHTNAVVILQKYCQK